VNFRRFRFLEAGSSSICVVVYFSLIQEYNYNRYYNYILGQYINPKVAGSIPDNDS